MDISFEQQFLNNEEAILFCDEVGRGPIAGPVNACTVIFKDAQNVKEINANLFEIGINDSKKLSAKKRKQILETLNIDLSKLVTNKVYDHGHFQFVIKEKSPAEIDQINILQASLLSMGEGVVDLIGDVNSALVLIDGNKVFDLEKISKNKYKNKSFKTVSVVKGDAKSAGISLASVIAKEYRDYLMEQLDKQYPGYGLSKHAGYPTVAHKEAVATLGVTPIHRKSFKGVREHLPIRS